MATFKKTGVLLSATALTVGLLAPMASASTFGQERTETLPIQVAQADAAVTKEDLLKRYRELFPDGIPHVTEKDFRMGTGYSRPEDTTVRYELSFSKEVDNQYIYGSFTFVGKTLELEQFYYQPVATKDVLFPAKYSKADAQKVADEFVKKFNKDEGYELVPSENIYYSSSILTQPIEYSFTYMKKKAGIPILDQSIHVGVRGDGTVTYYYMAQGGAVDATYDDPSKKQSEAVIADRLRGALKA